MTDFLDTWAKENDEHARLIAEERLITEVTEALWDTMQQAGISKSELASRLGKSKGHISQLFSGSRNMTLRTLAEICSALDCVPGFSVSARCAGKRLKRLRSHSTSSNESTLSTTGGVE